MQTQDFISFDDDLCTGASSNDINLFIPEEEDAEESSDNDVECIPVVSFDLFHILCPAR